MICILRVSYCFQKYLFHFNTVLDNVNKNMLLQNTSVSLRFMTFVVFNYNYNNVKQTVNMMIDTNCQTSTACSFLSSLCIINAMNVPNNVRVLHIPSMQTKEEFLIACSLTQNRQYTHTHN